MARSVFETSTFKAARVAMIAGAAVAILNILSPVLIDFFPGQAKPLTQAISIINTVAGLFGVGGSAGTVLGRAKADGPVESPSWMPGANRGELEEQQAKEDKLDQVLSAVSAVAAVAGAGGISQATSIARTAGRIIPDEVI